MPLVSDRRTDWASPGAASSSRHGARPKRSPPSAGSQPKAGSSVPSSPAATGARNSSRVAAGRRRAGHAAAARSGRRRPPDPAPPSGSLRVAPAPLRLEPGDPGRMRLGQRRPELGRRQRGDAARLVGEPAPVGRRRGGPSRAPSDRPRSPGPACAAGPRATAGSWPPPWRRPWRGVERDGDEVGVADACRRSST